MAIDSEYVDELFSEQACLFIFDALNEIATAKHDVAVNYIKGLARFIVSCRSLDYKQEFSSEKDVARIEILDLDLKSIKNAIEHRTTTGLRGDLWTAIGGNDYLLMFWNNLIKEGQETLFWKAPSTLRTVDLEMLKEESNTCDYEAWLEMHKHGLLPLCRNPMLLKMVYDLYLNSNKNLPSNRGKLFEEFVADCIKGEISNLEKKGEKTASRLNELKNNTLAMLTYLSDGIIADQQGTGIEYRHGRLLLKQYFADDVVSDMEKFAHDPVRDATSHNNRATHTLECF